MVYFPWKHTAVANEILDYRECLLVFSKGSGFAS